MNRKENKKRNRSKLKVIPCSQKLARKYVKFLHRHHRPPQGSKFCLAVIDENHEVRGIIIAGRPVARKFDDGLTVEITRCATDGCPNACSALYGAAAKTAKAMGFTRIVTYTLPQEGGASLRGAGWKNDGVSPGGKWRPRNNANWSGQLGSRNNDWPMDVKTRWVKELNQNPNPTDIKWPHAEAADEPTILDLFNGTDQ